MKSLNTLFPVMMEFLRWGSKPSGVARKTSSEDKKCVGKTHKGAVHKVNPTFHSRQIMAVSPATYRSMHMGKQVKE